MNNTLPVLWSFRRCPYAMRARMAILSAGQAVELREIKLREKPDAFLAASPSATVPALVAGETNLDESLDIMIWALKEHDPQGLLNMPAEGWDLITQNDGPFKAALDHTKYATRYPDLDPDAERQKAAGFIQGLDKRLAGQGFLVGPTRKLADLAIFPFIRQFANIDRDWFNAQPWPNVIDWLDQFLQSPEFETAMQKFPLWAAGSAQVRFGMPHPNNV